MTAPGGATIGTSDFIAVFLLGWSGSHVFGATQIRIYSTSDGWVVLADFQFGTNRGLVHQDSIASFNQT